MAVTLKHDKVEGLITVGESRARVLAASGWKPAPKSAVKAAEEAEHRSTPRP